MVGGFNEKMSLAAKLGPSLNLNLRRRLTKSNMTPAPRSAIGQLLGAICSPRGPEDPVLVKDIIASPEISEYAGVDTIDNEKSLMMGYAN